jgi:subtilase family serine protease
MSKKIRRLLSFDRLESRDCPSSVRLGSPLAVSYIPGQIRQAYGLLTPSVIKDQGAGVTVAIVDSYSNPDIKSNLAAFDRRFNIPPPPSFKVMGSAPVNYGWGLEESLDVEWVHAIAPKANIILEQASDDYLSSLFVSVEIAVNLPNVSVVSLSWGSNEFSGEHSIDSFMQPFPGHNPVTVVASSGDTGGIVSYPAAATTVLSVGGTSLHLNSHGNYSFESAWSDGGGGPSQFNSPIVTPQVSANADPRTGVVIYDAGYTPRPGWLVVGGTSFSAPFWGAIVGIADSVRVHDHEPLLGTNDVYYVVSREAKTVLHDVTIGASTFPAGPGFDDVTGWGTPKGNKLIPALVKIHHRPTTRLPHVTLFHQPHLIETPFHIVEESPHA